MSTTVCPKCGATLDANARFCAGCGQAVSAPPAGVTGPPPPSPGQTGGKKLPVLPLAIFGGGLVVLVGALTFMRSNAPPGGEAAPGAVAPASSSGISTAPNTAVPATVTLPGAQTTPAIPATTSAFASPETLPPAVPGSLSSSSAAPAAAVAGTRAPSTKNWKDPLAPGGGSAPPPKQAATGLGAPPSAPIARPASPAPPPVSRTYDCRENAIFNITPEDIHITVDGQSIGTSDRWDGTDERKKYVFRGPGAHYVKLSHEKYETVWLKFDVSESSIYRTADVDLQMKRLRQKGD